MLQKNRTEMLLLVVLCVFISVVFYLQMYGFHIFFSDTDDYMRLVRVREFFDHRDLSNNVISRCNVPYGCCLHWTRFYDFFIIVPTYILNIFIDSVNEAAEYVGFLISPVVKCITVVLFFNLLLKSMKRSDAFLAAGIFVAHPYLAVYGILGRADHHAFIMLFTVIFLRSVADLVESGFKNQICILKTAIVSAICIWISPEMLIPLLLTDVVSVYFALFGAEKSNRQTVLKALCDKNALISFWTGIIALLPPPSTSESFSTVCLLATTIPYVLSDRIPNSITRRWHIFAVPAAILLFSGLGPTEYDKISAMHAALYVCSCICLGMNAVDNEFTPMSRIIRTIIWPGIIILAFLQKYPYFLNGMEGNLDPQLKPWLSKIAEMRSPIVGDNGIIFAIFDILLLLFIAGNFLKPEDRKLTGQNLMRMITATNAACYTVFGAMAYRMFPYALLFGIPFAVNFIMNCDLTKSLHRLYRIILSFFLLIFLLMLHFFFDSGKNATDSMSISTAKELYEVVDALSEDPVVIMADTDAGPSILYYTKHNAVGANYHRQGKGIIFSRRIMEDPYCFEAVKSALTTTDSSYILVKKKESRNRKSLAGMIIDNNYPDWISIVELPKKFKDVIIAKIDKKKLERQIQ